MHHSDIPASQLMPARKTPQPKHHDIHPKLDSYPLHRRITRVSQVDVIGKIKLQWLSRVTALVAHTFRDECSLGLAGDDLAQEWRGYVAVLGCDRRRQ